MNAPPPIDPASHALFLDFDGTLAELVDDPDAVHVTDGMVRSLQALQARLGGALAIVSGRTVASIDGFLSPAVFAAVGVHGLERRITPSDTVQRLAGAEALDDVRRALNASLGAQPGIKLEDKGTALVLHTRTAPQLSGEAARLMQAAAGARADLTIMHGKDIVEVHPAGMDKGRAVTALLSEPPFRGRVPVYAGDDTTDEFALQVVKDAGGVAVKVGPGDSVASFRLPDVAAVHGWIAAGAGEGTHADR
ncbi:trehalose-phosphatase [Mangrovicella endophytica]|uniref:trehalose-phosphatase n=1 Tax=Mangrovicella endophytica TaxID=2066697 RepID=UPI000C9DA77A|nr:trehalose-phosphatase [Mangrovicella endophytica]